LVNQLSITTEEPVSAEDEAEIKTMKTVVKEELGLREFRKPLIEFISKHSLKKDLEGNLF
jgi:hypothetical protein